MADTESASLIGDFRTKFGREPDFIARAPGRVNLIGEHIDYCGYAVFPMAIEQAVTMAAAVNGTGTYNIENVDAAFQSFSTSANNFEIDGKSWQHYMLCGHKGIIDELGVDSPVGVDVLVKGSVPKSAGLSSSSALVCCSGLVTKTANGKEADAYQMAEICARCERHIGTEGGGMDQSISFLAEVGKAKLIEFNPLRATTVTLPNGATFVIANSLREMTKSENAGQYFNLRVVECRIAAQMLAKIGGHEWRKVRRLVVSQNLCKKSLEEMLLVVEENFHREPYSRDEVCKVLDITDDEFIRECASESTREALSFELYKRAKHVYSEAARVLKFKDVCETGGDDALTVLGALMNESHASCSNDYDCSCEELDELTRLCRSAGALGSRLTGAGWGGCTVSLVPSESLAHFLQKVRVEYYMNVPSRAEKINEALFATTPGGGATVYEVRDGAVVM